MRKKVIIIILLITVSVALLWLASFIKPITTSSSSTIQIVPGALSPTVPPHSSTQSTNTEQTNGLNPAVIAAIIGLVGAIVAAIIAGVSALDQSRRVNKIENQRFFEQLENERNRENQRQAFERQRQAEQQQYEQQRQAEQQQYEERLLHLQKELERQFKEKERVEQQEAIKSEALRLKMLQAQTNNERAVTYRLAIFEDPRISRLQILDMSHPLMLANIYVRVRVHQETRASYEINPAMQAAELKHDPNALLQASLQYLEQRSSSALDPSAAIRTYKHCVILGDPGAGKTTLLKYLTLQSAANKLDKLPDLPIFVELNAFASSGHYDLLDFASLNWEERYGFLRADARSFMEEKLHEGNALLLLDALDETAIGNSTLDAEASYQYVIDNIIKIATRYYKCPIVVTARKAGYQQRAPLQGFTELEVLDFRPDDIHQFVINWFENSQNPQGHIYATDLITKLEQNSRMSALAANPLLLSIIVLVYQAQLDLPDRRAELYKRCVEALLTEWDAKRNIRRRREFKPEHKRQLLEEIAWHFHIQGRRYFPLNELLGLIADFLPKIHLPPEQNEQILTEIANEQGLLKEQAKGWQGFLHLTLQEYFVALYIVENQQMETLLLHCGDPWWEEVLLLYAGYTSDASLLLRELLGHQDGRLREDLFQTNLVLAGRCLVARPTLRDASLWDVTIERLFKVLITTPYSLVQEHLIAILTAIDSLEVNKRLQALLFESQLNESARESIAEGLGRSAENTANLEQLLSNRRLDLNILERIAIGLGSSNRPIVLRFLKNSQIPINIRQTIAKSLGRAGERSTVQLLSNSSLDLPILNSIAEGLGDLGERVIVPDLLELLSDTQINIIVRGSIALALGRLGEHSIVPDLLKLLANRRIIMPLRGCIFIAIYQLGERQFERELKQLLSDTQIDQDIRQSVAKSLGRAGERSTVQLLSNSSLDLPILNSIAEGLGDSGERVIVPDLLELLSDTQINIIVRGSIALALGRLGEHSIVPDLLKLLANPQIEGYVRIRIADSLGYLGDSTNIPDMREKLSSIGNILVRTHLALSLARLGDNSIANQLLHLLSESELSKKDRKEIASSLGRLKELTSFSEQERSHKAVELTHFSEQELFSNNVETEDIGTYVSQVLSRLENRSAIPEMLQMLSDPQIDRYLRIRIAETLGKIECDEAIASYLIEIFPKSDISDQIHRTLWTISRRLGIRIFITSEGKLSIVKL